jgi:hypothetical protein
MNQNNIFKKFKNKAEFYSIVGIKILTFNKMVDILKTTRTKKNEKANINHPLKIN